MPTSTSGKREYLKVAVSACEHILRDLDTFADGDGLCISYIPADEQAGAQRQYAGRQPAGPDLFAHTGTEAYRDLAEKAIRYTAQHQRPDASWYYGEKANLHWVDNFHTAYVLDCFKHYGDRHRRSRASSRT